MLAASTCPSGERQIGEADTAHSGVGFAATGGHLVDHVVQIGTGLIPGDDRVAQVLNGNTPDQHHDAGR